MKSFEKYLTRTLSILALVLMAGIAGALLTNSLSKVDASHDAEENNYSSFALGLSDNFACWITRDLKVECANTDEHPKDGIWNEVVSRDDYSCARNHLRSQVRCWGSVEYGEQLTPTVTSTETATPEPTATGTTAPTAPTATPDPNATDTPTPTPTAPFSKHATVKCHYLAQSPISLPVRQPGSPEDDCTTNFYHFNVTEAGKVQISAAHNKADEADEADAKAYLVLEKLDIVSFKPVTKGSVRFELSKLSATVEADAHYRIAVESKTPYFLKLEALADEKPPMLNSDSVSETNINLPSESSLDE